MLSGRIRRCDHASGEGVGDMGQLYQGIPRGEIPWFPIVNPEQCDEAVAEPYARMAEGKLLCVPCSGYGR